MVLDNGIYYDGYLHDNLILVREKVLRNDFDFMVIVDGTSGAGKSTLTMQLAYLVDPTFNISRICFRGDEFMKAVTEAKKYQAIILDEAYASLASADATTRMAKFLKKMLNEIRQKNLMIFFCCPSFFDLDKYLAITRSKLLIHVHVGKKMERGFFKLYTSKWKKLMYVNGKRTYDYTKGGHPSMGRFSKKLPPTIDEEAYRIKKDEALKYYTQSEEERYTMKDKNAIWTRDRALYLLWQMLDNNGHEVYSRFKEVFPEFPYNETWVAKRIKLIEQAKDETEYVPIIRRKRSLPTPPRGLF